MCTIYFSDFSIFTKHHQKNIEKIWVNRSTNLLLVSLQLNYLTIEELKEILILTYPQDNQKIEIKIITNYTELGEGALYSDIKIPIKHKYLSNKLKVNSIIESLVDYKKYFFIDEYLSPEAIHIIFKKLIFHNLELDYSKRHHHVFNFLEKYKDLPFNLKWVYYLFDKIHNLNVNNNLLINYAKKLIVLFHILNEEEEVKLIPILSQDINLSKGEITAEKYLVFKKLVSHDINFVKTLIFTENKKIFLHYLDILYQDNLLHNKNINQYYFNMYIELVSSNSKILNTLSAFYVIYRSVSISEYNKTIAIIKNNTQLLVNQIDALYPEYKMVYDLIY